MSFEDKVIIVGAGVAGLVLAQVLRKQGIPYEIYDRDDGSHRQGWAIALDKCLEELYPLLPDDVQDPAEASANVRAGRPDGFWFVNGETHEMVGALGNVPAGHPEHVIYANRLAFRDIFMQHVGVQFNKRFERYEEDEKGVSVYFTDGAKTRGSILVGADGASSAVREQLLDGFKATPSRYTAIHGNFTASKEQYEELTKYGNSGLLVGEDTQKNLTVLMDLNKDGTALFVWTLAYRVEDHLKEQAWARQASAQKLFEKVTDRVSHGPDILKNAIATTGPEGIHTPPIRLLETVLPEDVLPKGRVTLLGDAMHSMVPFRGMGANQGILGACLLSKTLVAGITQGRGIDDMLRSYEAEWIPKSRKIVLESRAAGEEEDDLSGGRLTERKAAKEATKAAT